MKKMPWNKLRNWKKAMQQVARDLQFEDLAVLQDRIRGIKENLLFGAE